MFLEREDAQAGGAVTAEWSGTRGSCVHDGTRWLDQSVMQAKERFMYAAVRMVWYYCWVELLDEGGVLIGDWRLQEWGLLRCTWRLHQTVTADERRKCV
jgi:hypothetical protein